MVKRVWSNSDFTRWLSAAGLSAPQAAAVLGISERSVKRIRTEDVGVKDGIAQRAQEWIRSTRVTTGTDALNLDSVAATMGFADVCAALPLAHITGMTSAIARGWTSANSDGVYQVSQLERMTQPKTVDVYRLEWLPTTDLPWGVECRIDADGRPYRIASAERTVIELAAHVQYSFTIDEVAEATQGAVDLSETPPDMQDVYRRARLRDPSIATRIWEYLSPSWREDVADLRRDYSLDD